jgi:uncharacterized protein with HEPN domain
MSSRTDIEFLQDIREAVRRIHVYCRQPEALTYDQFRADIRTQDAVIRNIEIIGEAVKGLSAPLRERYPEVPWKNMAGVRDRLIHGYFGINLDIVWDIATVELPLLEPRLSAILQKEQES